MPCAVFHESRCLALLSGIRRIAFFSRIWKNCPTKEINAGSEQSFLKPAKGSGEGRRGPALARRAVPLASPVRF
jgi:hypothetical protein